MKTIEIRTPAGACDATLHGEEDRPSVLLFMDVFGPRPALTEIAESIAAGGYRVLVPNLFYRRARPPYAEPMALMHAHTFAEYVSDVAHYLDVFGAERVRLVGYCLGGNVALRAAAAYASRVSAVASFHAGALVTEATDSPHRQLARVTAELFVGHADEDASMTPEQRKIFAAALVPPRQRAELFAGARHGFTMTDRPVYDAAAAERSRRETFALFERVGR